MNFIDRILSVFTGRRPDGQVPPGMAVSTEARRQRYDSAKQQAASMLSQPRSAWQPDFAEMVNRADVVVVGQSVSPAALADWLALVGPSVHGDAQGWLAVLELRARSPQAAAVANAQAAAAAQQIAAAAQASSTTQRGSADRALPATSGIGNYVRGW